MNDLQFAYVAPHLGVLPQSVKENFLPPKWQVSSCELDAVEEITSPPDFMWVNFGKAPKLTFAKGVLKHLAHLQDDPQREAFIFISGSALPTTTYRDLVDSIYATLPNPTDVVADLNGQPDLGAAVAKFYAQRKARGLRLEQDKKIIAPVVHVPNADLRSERGRLSIKAVADVFGMDVIEIGRLIGRESKAALSKTPDAESLQKPLQPYSDIALLRAPGFDDEQFRKWLNAPNEHMKKRAPMDWISDGRVDDVASFVFNILTGQPS